MLESFSGRVTGVVLCGPGVTRRAQIGLASRVAYNVFRLGMSRAVGGRPRDGVVILFGSVGFRSCYCVFFAVFRRWGVWCAALRRCSAVCWG